MTTPAPSIGLKDWERQHALRVVAAVNSLRDQHRLTIPALRDRLDALGWSVSLETLNGILSSKKRGAFTAGEIFAFARALDVSPALLLAGLPSGEDLPAGAVLEDVDSVSVYQWITDAEARQLTGSPFSNFAIYAERMALTRWHNALWIASDGELGRGVMIHDLRALASLRRRWREDLESGYALPPVPALPSGLSTLRLDDWTDDIRVESPIPNFSDGRILRLAEAFVAGRRAAESTYERFRGPLSRPAAVDEEEEDHGSPADAN